jgi:hypothetical protein
MNAQDVRRAAPIVPVARPQNLSPFFPGPTYYVIGDELPATPANAERYVALAGRAMARCAGSDAAAADYRGAVSALRTKQYRVAMAASRNAVDDCVVR